MRYILVQWPESQYLMDHERFHECLLVQDIDGHDEVGSSAYMCPEDLYTEILKISKYAHLYEDDGFPSMWSLEESGLSARARNCLKEFYKWKEIDPKRISIKTFTQAFPQMEVLKVRNCGIVTLTELDKYFKSKKLYWELEYSYLDYL